MTAILERRETVVRLLRDRDQSLVVSGLGSATYDVFAAGDHPQNYYLWGAMGGAAMMGLGLALAQVQRPVVVITGDGESLMALGALATIGHRSPGNLSIVVLDNAKYGETGAQDSHTGSIDLAAVAKACGIEQSLRIEDATGLDALAQRIHRIEGVPCFAVIRIDNRAVDRALPSRDSRFNKGRFRQSIGLPLDG